MREESRKMMKQIVRIQLAAFAVMLTLGIGTVAKADDVTLTGWRHDAGEARRCAAGERPVHAGRVSRSRDEGASRRHDAHCSRRRRPTLSRRLHLERGTVAQTGNRGLRKASRRPVVIRGPARRRGVYL